MKKAILFKKRAFTVAEIVIVMMILGIIGILTVSIMVPSVDDSRYRASYRKSFTAFRNVYDAERYTGMIGSIAANKNLLFNMMKRNFFISYYAQPQDEGYIYTKSDMITENALPSNESVYDYWISTDDNVGYRIVNKGANCRQKKVINGQLSSAAAINEAACFTIMVDVNGLTRGPNLLSEQDIEPSEHIGTIKNDRFYIYVGSDGASAGNNAYLVTGRIVSGLK